MAENEKFSFKKFIDFSPPALYTVAGLTLKVAIITLLIYGGYTIWQTFFGPSGDNINEPTINVSEGGTATYNVIQQQSRKRFLIPFVEVYADLEEEQKDVDFGVRVGARFEW